MLAGLSDDIAALGAAHADLSKGGQVIRDGQLRQKRAAAVGSAGAQPPAAPTAVFPAIRDGVDGPARQFRGAEYDMVGRGGQAKYKFLLIPRKPDIGSGGQGRFKLNGNGILSGVGRSLSHTAGAGGQQHTSLQREAPVVVQGAVPVSGAADQDSAARHGENIEIKYRTLVQDSSNKSGAWELQVKYPSLKEYVYIPVCVINGNLYLNFFIKQNFYQEVPSPDNPEETIQKLIPEIYYLKDTGAASGITISPPVIKNELLSYFVDGSSVYHIRYWLSDMELTSEQAEFSDDENEYRVNKFLKTAGRLYTCTTGRSTKIRNIQKSSSLKFEYVLNEESTILATGKPYLVKVPAPGNREELQKIVDENNKRKAPPPPPLFPPSEINFHWKEISELEMYNPYTWNRRNLDLHK